MWISSLMSGRFEWAKLRYNLPGGAPGQSLAWGSLREVRAAIWALTLLPPPPPPVVGGACSEREQDISIIRWLAVFVCFRPNEANQPVHQPVHCSIPFHAHSSAGPPTDSLAPPAASSLAADLARGRWIRYELWTLTDWLTCGLLLLGGRRNSSCCSLITMTPPIGPKSC